MAGWAFTYSVTVLMALSLSISQSAKRMLGCPTKSDGNAFHAFIKMLRCRATGFSPSVLEKTTCLIAIVRSMPEYSVQEYYNMANSNWQEHNWIRSSQIWLIAVPGTGHWEIGRPNCDSSILVRIEKSHFLPSLRHFPAWSGLLFLREC